jgi:hypothetical protein
MKEYLELLGFKVHDPVTGATGIASSISFDVSGCVQVAIRLPMKKEETCGECFWVDIARVRKVSKISVIKQPTFVKVTGGEIKPKFSSLPNK